MKVAALISFSFLKVVLRGLGQIMLQENAFTGLLFLIGLFYASPMMGLAALTATFTGTLLAILLHFKEEDIQQGLYGFSPALVGVAAILFLGSTPLSWFIIFVGSMSAAYLQHFFIQRKIAVFTLPFVLVTWLFYYCCLWINSSSIILGSTPLFEEIEFIHSGFRSFGQVIFQGEIEVGILFFIAVFISAPLAASYSFITALLTGIAVSFMGIPAQEISFGLWGFNIVLTTIVFTEKKKSDFLYILIAAIISTLLSFAFTKGGLLQLTFPFVLSSILTLQIKKML